MVAPTPFAGRSWYPLLVLSVALSLTAAGSAVLDRAIHHTDEDRFQAAIDGAESRITHRMDTYVAMLRSTAGLFDSQASVDRRSFARFIDRIGLTENYPGSRGIGWAVPVPRGSETDLENWLHTQGYPDAHLWPSGDRAERTAVLLQEPLDERSRVVIGFDLGSDPTRREAMDRARATGKPAASAPLIPIVKDSSDPHELALHLYLPTYGADREFRGYVFMPMRGTPLFRGILGDDGAQEVSLRVSDRTGDGVKERFYVSPGWNEAADAKFKITRTIDMCGRTWAVEYRSTPRFEAGSSAALVPLFASAGAMLGFLLFVLARSLSRAVAENASLYRASIAGRREAEINLELNQRLVSDLDTPSLTQAVTDAGRELTGALFGAFFTTVGEGAEMRISPNAISGVPASRFAAFPMPRITALFRPTIEGKGVVRLDDVRTDPRYGRNFPHAGVPDGHIPVASYLAVPVRARSGVIVGGLLYGHSEPGRFTTDHERLLLGLAAQAAIALENARLFEAEREARRIAAHRAEDLAQANAELQQFVYVSSHDLQEPLRTITQYLDLLKRRHGGNLVEQAIRYISYASDSASRMYSLLNDLLTYSRLGREAERSSVPLAELVDEVLQDLRATLGETSAHIEVGALPVILCERSKIRLVFQNLIGNALKFRGREVPRIAVSAVHDDDGVWTISVADNGIGISPEHHRVVFEVFERLHDRDSFPGTGIGLAICRKVVEQHGGRIWVDSSAGHGSSFRFTLPEDGSGEQPVVRP